MIDLQDFNSAFYGKSDKIYQDDFIIKYCLAKSPIRKRTYNGKGDEKQMILTYLMRKSSGETIPVCQNFFLRALSIKKGRVRGVMMRHKSSGMMAMEKRGGDHKSEKNKQLKEDIISFIKQFKGVESHYCRSKSRRVYLPSDLNVATMHKMFINEKSDCKLSFFRKIFNTKFNISFLHPRSDMCSKCLELKEKIRIEPEEIKLQQLKTDLDVHTRRANVFFDFLKEKSQYMKTLSFDCGKNQPLPKVPDQAAYYSRQLHFYNYTIVEGDSQANINKNNVFSYVWTEDIHTKGPNELASALYHCLQNRVNLDNVKILRLMADGCSGQNKNSILIGMLSKWLASDAPAFLKRIELVFPVTGHSFIPPDRVFGLIEKEIKRRNIIVKPEEYINFVKNHATVTELNDIQVLNWKSAIQEIQKGTNSLPFKIMSCKRFIFSRKKADRRSIIVRGEVNYKSDTACHRTITKPGKCAADRHITNSRE